MLFLEPIERISKKHRHTRAIAGKIVVEKGVANQEFLRNVIAHAVVHVPLILQETKTGKPEVAFVEQIIYSEGKWRIPLGADEESIKVAEERQLDELYQILAKLKIIVPDICKKEKAVVTNRPQLFY